jgi:hypothetical protein
LFWNPEFDFHFLRKFGFAVERIFPKKTISTSIMTSSGGVQGERKVMAIDLVLKDKGSAGIFFVTDSNC